jgi:predicted GIY-YIG superfamily endonuclease
MMLRYMTYQQSWTSEMNQLCSMSNFNEPVGGFIEFGNFKDILYISGMTTYYTYKINDLMGKVVYVGYSKQPWVRERQHLQNKDGRFYDSGYSFQIVGEYKTDVEARYNEERMKREFGFKGEMGDKRFIQYRKRYEGQ